MTISTLKAQSGYDVRSLRNLDILLVDDSTLNTKLASILFSQNGLKLIIAENGIEAIERIKAEHFHIILMDIEMPVMNGYETTTMIRHELKNNIPIIAMTAHTMAGEKEKCLRSGMNGYISKPISEVRLFTMIHDLTQLHMYSETTIEQLPAFSEKVCNLDYLTEVTRGNKEIQRTIIDVFLEETPKELSALRVAIDNRNYKIIADISHKIKSSFSIMGITVLENTFEEMEQLGNTASGIDKIEILNSRINAVFGQAMEEMKEEI